MDTFDDRSDAAPPRGDLRDRMAADFAAARELPGTDPAFTGAAGATMFDLPGSTDDTLTVLLARDNLRLVPAQSLVRVASRTDGDGKRYLGVVTAGPFAEPDSLRGDDRVLTTMTARGGSYRPPFHGRVQVTLLGEELADGTLAPPRWRPLPGSPVFVLPDAECERLLKAGGDLRLGLAVGHERVAVGVPSDRKDVLPRHTAILGTTGGGKSNTVARLVQQAQAAGLAVVLLDVEGEYARLHEPTDDRRAADILAERGLAPAGLPGGAMRVYHLAGRDTANPQHPDRRPFVLQFARLSPYAAAEIMGLTEPQQERFHQAYGIARELLRELGIFPEKQNAEQERFAAEIDEFARGYPRLTLSLMIDVAGACLHHVERAPKEKPKKGEELVEEGTNGFEPFSAELRTSAAKAALKKRVAAAQVPSNAISWKALLGRLHRLNRLKVFDRDPTGAKPMSYKHLLEPGKVSVIDLSDTALSELSNLVIADILRGVQDAQDEACQAFERGGGPSPAKVLIAIEEAHEFLSDERIGKMPVLFEQVATLAKRGRKRWLGLAFVTQLPGHLPRQVLGLCNGFILHKLTDPSVVSMLKKSVGGIDEGLWSRLPTLAPGQAVVSFPHMLKPLLTSIDPSPAKLRLAE
ncbi:MAG: ATP-binding protein [Gemmataceae bacterium]